MQQTFEAQRDALFGTLHGIYCDPASGEQTRLNALNIFEPFKASLSPKAQSDLVDRHQEYKAKGDNQRSKASLQFFENIGLLSLLGEAELHAIFTNASQNLFAVHSAMNNFYNEPPFAQRLSEMMVGSAVPASAQYAVVEAIVTRAVGNPYGVSNAAVPWYEKMIRSFSPNEVAIMLDFGSLPNTIINQRMKSYSTCRYRFAKLIALINSGSVPTLSQTQYNFWIAKSKK